MQGLMVLQSELFCNGFVDAYCATEFEIHGDFELDMKSP